jgi:hypothetical protein
LRPQSVADHSFRVAVIYIELCKRMEREPSISGLRYALVHDGGESRSGDIPTPFKKRIYAHLNGNEAEYVDIEKSACDWMTDQQRSVNPLVAISDQIEAYTFIAVWGHGEYASRVADRIRRHLHEYCIENGADFGIVDRLCKDITSELGRDQP